MDYAVYILDNSQQRIARVQNLVVKDKRGNILTVIKRLSNYGECSFRIAKHDPIFTDYGNIINSWKYGVEVTHNQATIFKGIVVNTPHMTKTHYDVTAFGYMYRLDKRLIKRDPETLPGDGKDNYRTFSTGTLSAAITATVTEAKTGVPSTDILSNFTLGNIVNPNFPSYFTKADKTPLTGPWTFSSDMTLQFDYKTVLYVLKAFGVYSNCDFEVTDSLVVNFAPYIGVDRRELVFEYSPQGSVYDYDIPLVGTQIVNSLMGIAADLEGNILHVQNSDQTSLNNLGVLLEGVMGFIDVKGTNALRARTTEELRFISTGNGAITVAIDASKSFPLGNYDVGDTVTIKVQDGIVNFNEPRRITGIHLTVHNTGRGTVILETNPPRDNQ